MFWNGSTTTEGLPGSANIGGDVFAASGLPNWTL